MKLIPRSQSYRRAHAEAELARSRFLLALDKARSRLHPRELKQDLERKVSETAQDVQKAAAHTARSHPFITGGALTVVIGLVFRRPIAALTRKARVSLYNAWKARRESGDEQ